MPVSEEPVHEGVVYERDRPSVDHVCLVEVATSPHASREYSGCRNPFHNALETDSFAPGPSRGKPARNPGGRETEVRIPPPFLIDAPPPRITLTAALDGDLDYVRDHL